MYIDIYSGKVGKCLLDVTFQVEYMRLSLGLALELDRRGSSEGALKIFL
jgi:hypothetical protein